MKEDFDMTIRDMANPRESISFSSNRTSITKKLEGSKRFYRILKKWKKKNFNLSEKQIQEKLLKDVTIVKEIVTKIVNCDNKDSSLKFLSKSSAESADLVFDLIFDLFEERTDFIIGLKEKDLVFILFSLFNKNKGVEIKMNIDLNKKIYITYIII